MSKLSKENIKIIRDYLFSFEKDAKVACTLFEREEIRKKFREIDREENFEISNYEIGLAISSIERDSIRKKFIELDEIDSRNYSRKMFIRYAVAVSLIFFIAGNIYFYVNDNDVLQTDSTSEIIKKYPENNFVKKDSWKKSKYNRIPILKSILRNKIEIIEKDSIEVKINYLNSELEELNDLQKIIADSNAFENKLKVKNISQRIRILKSLENTYTYNKNLLTLNLYDTENKIDIKIINIEIQNNSKLYLNIESDYYEILNCTTPKKFEIIKDKNIISILEDS